MTVCERFHRRHLQPPDGTVLIVVRFDVYTARLAFLYAVVEPRMIVQMSGFRCLLVSFDCAYKPAFAENDRLR